MIQSELYGNIKITYLFEWEVSTNDIKRIEFADVPVEDGANGSEITMAFKERYYEKYDIFQIDATGQQCFVVARPVRVSDNYWKVIVRLIDNDYSSVLDKSGCQLGMTTRFLSNAMPEMHEIRAVYPERVIHLNFFNYWETKQFKIAC